MVVFPMPSIAAAFRRSPWQRSRAASIRDRSICSIVGNSLLIEGCGVWLNAQRKHGRSIGTVISRMTGTSRISFWTAGTGFSTSTTLMTGCGSRTPQRLQFGLVAHCTSSQLMQRTRRRVWISSILKLFVVSLLVDMVAPFLCVFLLICLDK